MTPVLRSAELFLLAWFVLVAVGSLLAAIIVRTLAHRLNTWEPSARHRALVLLAALPLLAACALMLSATLPSILSLELSGFDHCATHGAGHPHLCFVHLPNTQMSAAFVSLLVVIVSYSFLRAGFASARVVRALRVLGALAMSGENSRDLGVTIIETSQPLCIAAGLLRPRVLLSRGLLESLTPDERAVVLAHERAHVRRRDALVASVVRVLVTLHLPSVSRWLVCETDVAAEQACDEEAGQLVGDRLAVASAILAVERAAQHAAAEQLAPVAVAFGQRAAERRVESLLAEPRSQRSLVLLGAGLGVIASCMLAASSELHHSIESLLSVIAY